MNIGSVLLEDGRSEFSVWAPLLRDVKLLIVSPEERLLPMHKDARGYWQAVANLLPGSQYFFKLEGDRNRPDPASHFQPAGVHGPSQVVAHSSFPWQDTGWAGRPLHELIIYELHIGTFTPGGTFAEAVTRIADLADLGINAIEIMPVAQFPGERNWGYDGTYPFAVQNSYGGPPGLKHFVNECHRKGISVILDVVYNHLGPEGNYLWDFGPYFTNRYLTPWGDAVNFDGSFSDEVRNYFIENALHWFTNYHIDALRLDAIHSIIDVSAKPFLAELKERIEQFSLAMGRAFYLIAESELNDPKVIRSPELGGYGLDGLWCDDFHHALHTLLTGEKEGYYVDFGKTWHLRQSFTEGFTYSGQYSEFRKKRHGASSKKLPAQKLVVFSQNHDQVGNRMTGDRLSTLVSFEAIKLAAGAVLFSPYIPLLYMGEEYGEEAPFLYFISHADTSLIEAVRNGRKEEFEAFIWQGEPPDPQSTETFLRSKLRWETSQEGWHRILRTFYKRLITLRKVIPALSTLDKENLKAHEYANANTISLHRWNHSRNSHSLCFFNFANSEIELTPDLPEGAWRKALDSSDSAWQGPGAKSPETMVAGQKLYLMPHSVTLYVSGSDIP